VKEALVVDQAMAEVFTVSTSQTKEASDGVYRRILEAFETRQGAKADILDLIKPGDLEKSWLPMGQQPQAFPRFDRSGKHKTSN
jgi:hypothetical protein